jgi:nucleoside-diphosphate-sugar epimerase
VTTILVLGARGFLGRPIAEHLTAVGHDVRLHDRQVLDLETAPLSALRLLIERSRAEVVVNCVGVTGQRSRDLRGPNVLVVERLLRVLARSPEIRLVHLGSAAEYGIGERGRSVRETDIAAPVSEYGMSKLAATAMVREHSAARQLRATVLRVFNPVGAGAPESSVAGRAVAEFRRALLRHEPVVRLGQLDTWRDFVGVRDVARAVGCVAVGPMERGAAEVFNVGRGAAVHTRAMVKELADIAGFAGEILEDAPPSARSVGVGWQCADISAIAQQHGWRPRQTIHDMLLELWGRPDVGTEVSPDGGLEVTDRT